MKDEKKIFLIILISIIGLALVLVGAFSLNSLLNDSPEYTKTDVGLSASDATTSTTTTTTTEVISADKSFYQYAQHRAPKAQPADIDKFGKTLVLLNRYNELPEDYQWDLVYWSNGETVDNEILNKSDFDIQAVDRIAYNSLKKMFEDAEKEGCPLEFYSGYRSIVRQNRNFVRSVENNIKSGLTLEDAKAKTNQSRAYPGTSEHNIGLAIDILQKGSSDLSNNFEKTVQFKWLEENAENYGFVLRYPKDKTQITETIYEPWHYRFVGVYHAKEMNRLNLCLEEYIEYLEKE